MVAHEDAMDLAVEAALLLEFEDMQIAVERRWCMACGGSFRETRSQLPGSRHP